MIFNAFKSSKKLERELRDWYYDDLVRLLGPDEAFEMRHMVYAQELKLVAEEAMGRAYTAYIRSKEIRDATGDWGSMSENMRNLRGIHIVQTLAKKQRWRICHHGGGIYPYRIEIIEMR